jgi:hypothetical protein
MTFLAASDFQPSLSFDLNPIKQGMSMGVTKFRVVLEHKQAASRHFATSGRSVMLEHLFERLPE